MNKTDTRNVIVTESILLGILVVTIILLVTIDENPEEKAENSLPKFILPLVYGEEPLIPSWIKVVAGAWHEDKITDSEYKNAMEFLIEANIINIYDIDCEELEEEIQRLLKEIEELGGKVTEWKEKYEDAEKRRVEQSQRDAAEHEILYNEKDARYEKLKIDFDERIKEKSDAHDEEIAEYTDIIHERDTEIEDLNRQLNDRLG